MEDSYVLLICAFHAPTLAIPDFESLPAFISTTASFPFPSNISFLSYSRITASCSVVSDTCLFFPLHFCISFLSYLLPTQLQIWVGFQTVNPYTFSFVHGSLGIFLICFLRSTGKNLNRLPTSFLLLKITSQLPTTSMFSKCTIKNYPSYFRAFLKQETSSTNLNILYST